MASLNFILNHPGFDQISPDAFAFENLKLTLCNRVVMALATTVHAARQVGRSQAILPVVAIESATLTLL